MAQPPMKSAECLIVPHAGYIYSGPVAAHSYLRAFEYILTSRSRTITAIILGPNHYGIGSGIALSPRKTWQTPLGEVRVDEKFSSRISNESDIIDFDNLAHSREHSIEVQVPFLQVVCQLAGKELSIVPICLMLQDKDSMQDLSEALLSALREREYGSTLVIGSSDLTHYESQKDAYIKDTKLLDPICKLAVLDFYSILERFNVTACGYGAIATLIFSARGLGCKKGEVLKYATSADTTSDNSSVVGYSSVEFN